MKILMVASKYPPEYAGPGVRLHRTYARLAEGGGIERRVICNSVEFPGDADYFHDGVAVRRISSVRFREGGGTGRLRHAAKVYSEAARTLFQLSRETCDAIHVFGSAASPATAILWARLRHIPLVIELVTAGASPLQSLPGLVHLWRSRLHERTLIVAISEKLRETCTDLGFERNVWCRPNPVDEARFSPPDPEAAARLRRELTPFSANDKVLCSVAKFMPQKNQLFLIEMLATLPASYKLVLAGPLVDSGPLARRDREYFAAMHARIVKLGLKERVHLAPEFVDAAAYMKLADVYLMPNLLEGLGTPLLEALACDLPVVANRGEKSFHPWIVEGKSGFLRDLDPKAWREAVRAAVKSPPQTQSYFADKIRREAGTLAIDHDFRRLLGALVSLPEDGVLDVATVLKGKQAETASKLVDNAPGAVR
jgi:glycosyltransferase involved in cell wall biosynthesis